MIPQLHLWQSHYGAAHRKNVDTPPLTGLRLEPKWFQSEPCSNDGTYALGQIPTVPNGTVVNASMKEQRWLQR
jgi:hypothetical protein